MKPELLKAIKTPAAFFAYLLVDQRGVLAPLGGNLASFQQEALAKLCPDLEAVAFGRPPPIGLHVWLWSKGASKTTIISACLCWCLLASRKCLEIRAAAGDAEQAAEIVLAIRGFVQNRPEIGKLLDVDKGEVKNKITGSRIVVVSSDARTQHGGRPHISFVDEMVNIASEEFLDALIANATKMNGLVIVATNAGWENTWQTKRLSALRQSGRAYFSEVNHPAPWIPPAELADLEATMPQASYRRLFYSETASGTGEGLDPVVIEEAVQPGHAAFTAPACFIAGIDLGVRNDHAACVIVGKNQYGIRLAHVESWRPRSQFFGMVKATEIDLQEVADRIAALHKQFGLYTVVFDPWQASLMIQQLQKLGVPAASQPFTADFKQLMATSLVNGLRNRTVVLFRHAGLLTDLKRCRVVEKPFAGFALEWPRGPGGHCDIGTAFTIALAAASSEDAPSGEWANPAIGEPNPQALGLVAKLFTKIGLMDASDQYADASSKTQEMLSGATYTESRPDWSTREIWGRHDGDQ